MPKLTPTERQEITEGEAEGLAFRIVRDILADATDRRGWRQEWHQFDSKVQRRIRHAWRGIVRNALAARTDIPRLEADLTATEQDLAGARYELDLTRQENADLKARIERAKQAVGGHVTVYTWRDEMLSAWRDSVLAALGRGNRWLTE